ncbi:MAG: GAF domain-containing protein [Anaerolineales bacterium]|nr:GAF domain-containing protein [Anaerolineales bacterium]
MELNLVVVIVAVSLLTVGMLTVGLLVGYIRGLKRGRERAEQSASRPDLEMLVGIGRAILGAQLRPDALNELVYQQASRIVDTRNFQLGLFENDDYAIRVWVRDGERLPPQRFLGGASSGLIGWVRKTGSGIRVGDFVREWEALPAQPSYDSVNPPRSALFVPLLVGGEGIGVIAVQSDQADSFSDEQLRLLTVIANQIASAIKNAQLYRQARTRADQLRVISEVTRQLTAVQPLPNLFRQIVTLVHNTFNYYAVNVYTYDPHRDEVRLRASSQNDFDRRAFALKPGEGLAGAAYSQAGAIIVPDVSKDSRYLPLAALPKTRSEFCLPLMIERRVLGVLDVQSDQLDAFKDDDAFTLESLAGQLALAIQEAETFDAARRQAERLNAVAEASRAVVSILDVNDLLDEVVDLVSDYFGYDRVHLFLRSGERIVFRSGSGAHSARWSIEQLSYNLNDNGFIPWVARTGHALISGDVGRDERYVTAPGIEDTRSEMTVPIALNNRTLGVFDIQSTDREAFTPEDVTLVQALADTVAIGIRNAGLFATETRRRILAETLREVSAVLVSSLDLQSVLDGLLGSLERVVDYEAALILLRRGEERVDYVVRAVRGVVNEAEVLGQCILGEADGRRPVIDQMWELLRRMELPDPMIAESGQDRLYAPMQVGGREIGLLAVERIGPDQFNAEDIEIINTFANQAALAIEGAQLFAAQQEEAWVTTALLSVAESVNSTLDLVGTFDTLTRLTPMLVGVSWCVILEYRAEDRQFYGVSAYGLSTEGETIFKTFTLDEDHPFALAMLTHGTALILTGDDDDPDPEISKHPRAQLPAELVALLEVKTVVALPFVAKGVLIGVMLVERPALGEPGNRHQRLKILSGIAHQAALALETARLQEQVNQQQRLERELEVAQGIQRSFLPDKLPSPRGWELATFYRAARQVGGDFYDFIPLKENRIGIVIADVADKGVPAALFMALCRTNIRAAAFTRTDPVETMLRVNQLLLSDSRTDLFVTVWYGVWDPRTGEIVYACMGHNPPLVINSEGATAELSGKGIALGVVETMRLEKRRIILEPGDIMVAYTDGITDALRADNAEFGVVGLQSTVLTHRTLSAQEITDRVMRGVDEFSGSVPQFDDLTLIVLKRLGEKRTGRPPMEKPMLKPVNPPMME